MSLDIRFLLTMFGIFPAIIGFIKYKRVDKLYHPFIFMMWLEIFIEIIDYLSQKIPQARNIGYVFIDCYTIINFILFLLFVSNFKFISKNKSTILLAIALVVGTLNLFLSHTFGLLFYLIFYVSFIMLAISIDILTKQTMAIKQQLINNFWFWLSGTSIIYNAQLLLIFSTYFLAIHFKTLGYIFTFVNASCYILYAIAMFKIPNKIKNKKTKN